MSGVVLRSAYCPKWRYLCDVMEGLVIWDWYFEGRMETAWKRGKMKASVEINFKNMFMGPKCPTYITTKPGFLPMPCMHSTKLHSQALLRIPFHDRWWWIYKQFGVYFIRHPLPGLEPGFLQPQSKSDDRPLGYGTHSQIPLCILWKKRNHLTGTT